MLSIQEQNKNSQIIKKELPPPQKRKEAQAPAKEQPIQAPPAKEEIKKDIKKPVAEDIKELPKKEEKLPPPPVPKDKASPQAMASPEVMSSPNEDKASSSAKSKTPEKTEDSGKKENAGTQSLEEANNKRKKDIRERFGFAKGTGESPPKSNEKGSSGTPPAGHPNDILVEDEHPEDGTISMLRVIGNNEYAPHPDQEETDERFLRKNVEENAENKGTSINK